MDVNDVYIGMLCIVREGIIDEQSKKIQKIIYPIMPRLVYCKPSDKEIKWYDLNTDIELPTKLGGLQDGRYCLNVRNYELIPASLLINFKKDNVSKSVINKKFDEKIKVLKIKEKQRKKEK